MNHVLILLAFLFIAYFLFNRFFDSAKEKEYKREKKKEKDKQEAMKKQDELLDLADSMVVYAKNIAKIRGQKREHPDGSSYLYYEDSVITVQTEPVKVSLTRTGQVVLKDNGDSKDIIEGSWTKHLPQQWEIYSKADYNSEAHSRKARNTMDSMSKDINKLSKNTNRLSEKIKNHNNPSGSP